MNNRETFVSTATQMYPNKSDFTRSELVEVAQSMGMKYAPSWIVKSDEHKVGNGLYFLVANNVAPMATVRTNTVVETLVTEPAKTISIADTTIQNIIPATYSNYVPFGQFSDVKNIIKSAMFYPSLSLVYLVMVRQ